MVPTVLLYCIDCNHWSFSQHKRWYVKTLLASPSQRLSRRGRRHGDYPPWPEECGALHLHCCGCSGRCRAQMGPENNSWEPEKEEEDRQEIKTRQRCCCLISGITQKMQKGEDWLLWIQPGCSARSPGCQGRPTLFSTLWVRCTCSIQMQTSTVLHCPLLPQHRVLKTYTSAVVHLEIAAGLQANGPLLWSFLSCIHEVDALTFVLAASCFFKHVLSLFWCIVLSSLVLPVWETAFYHLRQC